MNLFLVLFPPQELFLSNHVTQRTCMINEWCTCLTRNMRQRESVFSDHSGLTRTSQHAHQLDHIVLLLAMLCMLLNVLLHEEHRSAGWFKVSCELFILKMKLLKPLTLLGAFSCCTIIPGTCRGAGSQSLSPDPDCCDGRLTPLARTIELLPWTLAAVTLRD